MSLAASVPTQTRPFRSSLQLQTARPTARSVSATFPTASEASEARYWAESFGLGGSALAGAVKRKQFAHPRAVRVRAGTASVVHQVLFESTGSQRFPVLAAVCGPRVQLYGTTPQSSLHRQLAQHAAAQEYAAAAAPVNDVAADRQVQTQGQPAVCASFRSDGRLLAVGTAEGVVRVADASSRATLRQFDARTGVPVRAVGWFRNGRHVLSAGDDGVLRIWRLDQGGAAAPAVTACTGHGDSIRCADLWQQRPSSSASRTGDHLGSWPYHSLAATGSYDHTVRLWNMDDLEDAENTDRCLAVLSHGAPVEALQWMRSDDPAVAPVWLVTAGGTTVKVWNPVTGNCVCTVQAQHRKTITSLLATNRTSGRDPKDEGYSVQPRLLTAGLDGLLRVHAWDGRAGQVHFLHGINMQVAITALAATPSGDRLAVGTVTGHVLVRQKGPSLVPHKRKREPRAGTYAFFTRGMNVDPGDNVVAASQTGKKRKLAKFDVALKQFRYGDALDEALATRIPQAVVAVLEELGKRRGLTIALSNRDEESLEPILSFTVRYICRPRFSALLIGVANKLIDIYGDVAGESETIDELFSKLKNQVRAECRAQKMLHRVVGQLDAILTAVEMDEQN